VPLAAGGWGGLTTTMHDVSSGTGPLPVGYHPELDADAQPFAFRPDLAALALPCAVILLLIAAALVAETSRSRRQGVTGLLRVQ
jgi:hypothetical protein